MISCLAESRFPIKRNSDFHAPDRRWISPRIIHRALTGFWIESSLMISPKEQVEVMEHIFGKESNYSEETQNTLKQVMLLSEVDSTDISIYGKTGMGKVDGIVVDAWFTGVA